MKKTVHPRFYGGNDRKKPFVEKEKVNVPGSDPVTTAAVAAASAVAATQPFLKVFALLKLLILFIFYSVGKVKCIK